MVGMKVAVLGVKVVLLDKSDINLCAVRSSRAGGVGQQLAVSTYAMLDEGDTMNRLTNLLSILVTTAVLCGLTTPVLAGPTPKPEPTECSANNPVRSVTVDGSKKKDAPAPFGGGTFTNKLLQHEITGHIIKVKNWKIDVCEGSIITTVAFDQNGTPVLIDHTPGLNCNVICCSGVISNKVRAKESMTYGSTGSGDVDTIEFKSPKHQ